MSEGAPKKSFDNVPEGKRLELYVPQLFAKEEDKPAVEDKPENDRPHERSAAEEFPDYLTPEEMKSLEDKNRDEIIRYILKTALGERAAGQMPDELWKRISKHDGKSEAIWKVIHKMKNSGANKGGFGSVIDENDELYNKVLAIFNKSERSGEHQNNAPEGLLSTEEAMEASQERSLLRRIAKGAMGLKDAALWFAGHPIYSFQQLPVNLMTWLNDNHDKWSEKYENLPPEEQHRFKRRALIRANLSVAALGGLYLASRGHAFSFISDAFGGNGGGGADHPDTGGAGHHDVPTDQTPDHHDNSSHDHFDPAHPDTDPSHFHYDPNLDPARDPAKHHNDWGVALQPSPDDGDKPAGYADFFNTRLHRSPEELSATLTEFGLNGKGNVTELANQMVNDPALAAQKYDQLMEYIHDHVKSVSIVTDGRDYGSYYAVANPDGTVTLSYDEFVESSSNLKIHGPTGNDFMAFTMDDGSVHYGHIDCGMQWSHFINAPAPHAAPVPAPPVSHHVPPTTPHVPPHHETPPPSAPPPSSPPPPPETPPPETPPPPPPPPPPGPDKVDHFPHPDDGTFQPAPSHTTPPSPEPIHVEQTGPSGASSSALPGTEHGSHPSSGVGESGPASSAGESGAHSGDQGPPS